MRVYLAGPMLGCSDDECHGWRRWCKERLRCEVVDPAGRDYRGRELANMAEIVERDKADILRCDVLLVNHRRPSVGTAMEVLFAWEHGKKVVTVNDCGPLSPWLAYHSDVVVGSLEQAVGLVNLASAAGTFDALLPRDTHAGLAGADGRAALRQPPPARPPEAAAAGEGSLGS